MARIISDKKMIDGTANIETATDRNAWKGLIKTTKGLNKAKKKKVAHVSKEEL
jgi:hypothetical protein